MSRVCEISGTRFNSANNVSHSHRKTRRKQDANLKWKRFWDPQAKKWVKVRVSSRVIKTVSRYGFSETVKRYAAV